MNNKKSSDALSKLTQKGLITSVLINRIEKGISHDSGAIPQVISWERLQNRILFLEKVSQSGRINDKTYKNIINSMAKDVEIVEGKDINSLNQELWQRYRKVNNVTDDQIQSVKKKVSEFISDAFDKKR